MNGSLPVFRKLAVAFTLTIGLINPFATDASSSSHGRKVIVVKVGGPPATPPAIYYINDEHAVNIIGAGHAAVIIPDPPGCTYYSYDVSGSVTFQHFDNITDALASAKATGYTREEHWTCSTDDAAFARDAAMAFAGTTYLGGHECWSMACAALQAAGTGAQDYGDGPNYNYNRNQPNADGSSHL